MKHVQKLFLTLALLCAYAPSLSAGKLHDLVENGNSKQVEEFLKTHAKASINTTDNDGRAPLHRACATGNLSTVKLLLENSANANILNKNGETPLWIMSRYDCYLPTIMLLLKYGANPNIPSHNMTPFYVACFMSNLPTAKLLLKNCADANLTINNGESPLGQICYYWSINKRKELLSALIPTKPNQSQNTKTFIDQVIAVLAKKMKKKPTIAPTIPQNDGLLKSQAVENPAQEIACIEKFIHLQLFTPHKKAFYTWPENFYPLNESEVNNSKYFKPSLSQFRYRYYCKINTLSSRQYAFLRMLQNMARKAITCNSSKTSSKAKQYKKLYDIMIKCHKPSSTESNVPFENVIKQYGK